MSSHDKISDGTTFTLFPKVRHDMAQTLARTLESQVQDLERIPVEELIQLRYEKFRAMGAFAE